MNPLNLVVPDGETLDVGDIILIKYSIEIDDNYSYGFTYANKGKIDIDVYDIYGTRKFINGTPVASPTLMQNTGAQSSPVSQGQTVKANQSTSMQNTGAKPNQFGNISPLSSSLQPASITLPTFAPPASQLQNVKQSPYTVTQLQQPAPMQNASAQINQIGNISPSPPSPSPPSSSPSPSSTQLGQIVLPNQQQNSPLQSNVNTINDLLKQMLAIIEKVENNVSVINGMIEITVGRNEGTLVIIITHKEELKQRNQELIKIVVQLKKDNIFLPDVDNLMKKIDEIIAFIEDPYFTNIFLINTTLDGNLTKLTNDIINIINNVSKTINTRLSQPANVIRTPSSSSVAIKKPSFSASAKPNKLTPRTVTQVETKPIKIKTSINPNIKPNKQTRETVATGVATMAPEQLTFSPLTTDFSQRSPVDFGIMHNGYETLLGSDTLIDKETGENLVRKTGGGKSITPVTPILNTRALSQGLTKTTNLSYAVKLASTLFYVSKKIIRLPVTLLIIATKDTYKYIQSTEDKAQEELAESLRIEFLHSIFLNDDVVTKVGETGNKSFFVEEFSKFLPGMFNVYKSKLTSLDDEYRRIVPPNNTNKYIRLDQLCYYLLTFAKSMETSNANIDSTDYMASLTLIYELCQRVKLITEFWFNKFAVNGETYHSRISFLNSFLFAKLKEHMNKQNSIITYVKLRIDGQSTADRNPRFGKISPLNKSDLTSNSKTLSIQYSDDSRGMMYSPNDPNDPNNPPIGTKILNPNEKFKHNYKFDFGPFSHIFTSGMTNSDIANSSAFATDIIGSITSGKPVCIIGYGASGSGKTSTLIKLIVNDENGNTKYEEDGIFMELTNRMQDLDYNNVDVNVCEFNNFDDIRKPTSQPLNFNISEDANKPNMAKYILEYLRLMSQ